MNASGTPSFAVFLGAALTLLARGAVASAAAPDDRGGEAPADREWRLGNEQLELKFQRRGSQIVAGELVNKLSGRAIALTEDDFSIGLDGRAPLCRSDFAFDRATEETIPGGHRLTLHGIAASPTARLDIIYELGDADGFVRRRLEVRPTCPWALREVEVWRVGLDGHCSAQESGVPIYLQLGPEWKYTAKHRGFGFPVFLDDTFWGLEYPAGYNHYEDGMLTLQHYPGRTVADRFVSQSAVLGVAEPGRLPERFRQYLEVIIGPSRSPPLFFAWKTWVTVNAPNETNCLALIQEFRRNLFDATGARLDSFALDDGWDKKASLWEIESRVFPRGFAPLQAALQPMRTRLGLWISPCSGYDHANWLAANRGYHKNAWDWLLCMSDPNYRRDMVQAVTQLVATHDVNYVKFDAFCAPCDDASHSYHLPDNFAKEANTDAYLELLTALRRTQPDLFVNLTTGTWLSPWWLPHVDSVWDQVYDGWSPAIAPTPERSYSQITDRDAVFRKRCLENPWFPFEALENLGIWTQNYRFLDEQIMTIVGRGCRFISFYVPVPQGDHAARDWAFLASAINWARHHQETLLHTRVILGDPRQLEPYGYAHFHRDRGILVLRNPFVTPQTARIRLDETVGWAGADWEQHGRRPLLARVVYPYHSTLENLVVYGEELAVDLGAYEMLVVNLAPMERSDAALRGVRCQETERAGNGVTYTIHGQPGAQLVLPLVGATPPSEVRWNGQPVTPRSTPRGMELPLALGGTPGACRVEGGRLVFQPSTNGHRITGNCVTFVPAGTPATMHLLWAYPEALHPPAARFTDTAAGFRLVDDAAEKAALRQQAERLRATKPRCIATLNAQPVSVTVNDSKLYRPENVGDHRMYAEYPPAPWVWFTFDLPPGRSEVAVVIECPTGQPPEPRPVAGWWLWAENRLETGTLTLSYHEPPPPAAKEPVPRPVRQAQERQILTLQTLVALPLDEYPPRPHGGPLPQQGAQLEHAWLPARSGPGRVWAFVPPEH